MSTFGGLQTVRTGLAAAQRGLDVVGQNIANANTKGYSRKEVANTTAQPSAVIQGLGRGVRQSDVVRYRDEFLDRQFRGRSAGQGFHDTRSQGLTQVEEIMGNLSAGGLRASLDQFFNSWDSLALRPMDAGARRQVLIASDDFVGQAKTMYQNLWDYRDTVDSTIVQRVGDINAAAQQVGALNRDILQGKAAGQEVHDLTDRRDLLIDTLAKLAGTTSTSQSDGSATVQLGSLPLVDGQVVYSLDTSSAVEATPPGQWVTSVAWNGSATVAAFASGEVAALMGLRDQTIPEHMSYVDNLVRTVATQVNQIHNPLGSNDDIFLINSSWMAIEVNPVVQADPTKIIAAGSMPPTASDGDRAQQIAALRRQPILTGDPVGTSQVTPVAYLQALYTKIGIDVAQAARQSDAAGLQVDQAEKQRQTVSGVSIDEEMTKMVQFQQAYNAAARVMTAIDEMIDTVINRIGLAGR